MTLHQLRQLLAASTAGALLLLASAARAEVVLRVSGTGSSLGTLRRLSDAFEKAHPGHRLKILPSVGSTGAIAAVANGALEVGISARPLHPSDEALGLTALPYARTPFVFAVGPRASVRGLTTEELVRIYRGELTRWGNGERIRLVMRPRTDADTALVRAISPAVSAAVDVAFTREGLLVAMTNQECGEIVSHTPGAIGPSSLAEITTDDPVLVPLTWNGVAPTVPNLASGAYPLAKTFAAVTSVPPSPPVRRFLEFLASAEARRILEQAGNLPLLTPPSGARDAERRR